MIGTLKDEGEGSRSHVPQFLGFVFNWIYYELLAT